LIIASARDVLERSVEIEIEGEMTTERDRLQEIRGVGEKVAKRLYEAGYYNPRYIFYEESAEQLDLKTGIGLKKAKQLQEAVVEYFEENESDIEQLHAERESWFEERRLEAEARTATRQPNLALLESKEEEKEEEGEDGASEGSEDTSEAEAEGEVVAETAAEAAEDGSEQ
jgi:hypothetical protein